MSLCFDSEGVYYHDYWITQALVPCIEVSSQWRSILVVCESPFEEWSLQHIQTQRVVLGIKRGNLSSFELFHSWCVAFMYGWPVLGQWPVPV